MYQNHKKPSEIWTKSPPTIVGAAFARPTWTGPQCSLSGCFNNEPWPETNSKPVRLVKLKRGLPSSEGFTSPWGGRLLLEKHVMLMFVLLVKWRYIVEDIKQQYVGYFHSYKMFILESFFNLCSNCVRHLFMCSHNGRHLLLWGPKNGSPFIKWTRQHFYFKNIL